MSILMMLRQESSPIAKINILRNYSTNLWSKAFEYAYHPDMQFGINSLGEEYNEIGEPSEAMFRLLDKLANKELTGNAAYQTVKDFMDEEGSLIALICKKDLNCGVSATTLNKAYGDGFIPQFKVQLAKEIPIDKVRLPVIAQIKYDGVRIIASITANGVKFKTRNGKELKIPNLESLLMYAGACQQDIVLDGELVFANGQSEGRTSVSGLVNSAIHGTPLDNKGINFVVFDAMPKVDFDKSVCHMRYTDRWAMASMFVNMFLEDKDLSADLKKGLLLAETHECDTHAEIDKLFEQMVEQGYEGLILKHWHHKYTFKRSSDWIKVKEIKDTTLICTDYENGKPGTKYEHEVGKLVCEGMVEGKFVQVKVGSGLSDAQRAVQNPLTVYVGEKIDVKYNAVIMDKTTGKYSLFLPRFVTIRKDI